MVSWIYGWKNRAISRVIPAKMKAAISLVVVAAVFAVVLPAPSASANPGKTPSMCDLMERLDKAYKGFRRETDPSKALPLVREAQAAVEQTMPLLPPMLEKMADGPAKAKAAATYRKMMAELYLMLADAELAFLEGDMEKVATLVTAMRESRKAGHEQFMEE